MSEVSAKAQSSKKSTSEDEVNKSVETSDQSSEKPNVANDVQRAIEGLKDIPDAELQEFLNDEDFMKGLDVVDAWEGEEDKTKKEAKGGRTKERDHAKASRERPRRDRKSSHSRDRAKREERKREDVRRDPSKSSKDIERDKIRTKKDTDSKILAEKEKAIKHLLDSDNVVPPGTEVEAIQDITEKQQNSERGQARSKRSRDRRRSRERSRPSPTRRRSSDRIRLSPHRRISDDRRQIRISPERRRIAGGSPNLRRSWERRASRDRSIERQRRREEREFARLTARRTRSRERQRSRSSDRYRKRWSRSPTGRRSNPRRSRSRSPDRRTRKRSPFINEIARQFEKEGLLASNFLPGIPPLMGQGYPQGQASPVPPPSHMPPFMHHPGPPGPSGMQHMQPPQFVNFEPRPPLGPSLNFDPARGNLPMPPMPPSEYAAGPIVYGQGNPSGIMPLPGRGPTHLPMPMHSPQPVPAPGPTDHTSIGFNQTRCIITIPATSQQQNPETTNRRPVSPRMPKPTPSGTYNAHPQRPERLKTPEPPIISNSKPFEKTSLSSLLEASVSAKDSRGPPVLYPGFKPEILRNCEQALRELPAEDLRLKMKGRFFFDPNKEESHTETEDILSNSILLRTRKNTIHWEESEKVLSIPETKPTVETHQKICQTDETETESKSVQALIRVQTNDFCVQVSSYDLQQAAKEEKRPIMDRLDWNVRETYDYAPKIREADDLRWSLSNSLQKRGWNRGVSPNRVLEEERELSPAPLSTSDHGSRGMNVGSSTRSRDNFSFHRSSSREHYSRDRFSPTYRGSMERQEEFHEIRSDHSRGESPMVLEDSPDEIEILDERFPRTSDWRNRGKSNYGSTSALQKLRALRGKSASRSYRGRGGFRGKF